MSLQLRKVANLFKQISTGEMDLETAIKTFLPINGEITVKLKINPVLKALGIPETTTLKTKLTTATVNGQEWIALLLIENK